MFLIRPKSTEASAFKEKAGLARFVFKSLTTQFKLMSICALMFVTSTSVAQRESQIGNQRLIYHPITGVNIGSVAAKSRYRVTGSVAGKLRVQFLQPMIAGWVSEQFLSERGEPSNSAGALVSVDVDVLNFRLLPSRTSQRVTQVYRGHQSRVLERRNGFVKIFAPASFEVLIDSPSNKAERVGSNDLQRPQAQENYESATADVSNPEVASNSKLDTSGSETVDVERNHLLAPGDSISLQVFGESDLSVENIRVPQNGRVSFPLIGAVPVLGKTTAEVEREVADLLSQGYVRNPRLSVTIFSYRPIFIRGEVSSLGAFPYAEGLTIAKAIALAGGLKSSAKPDGISITRDGEVVAENLSANSQVLVASGDIVSADADQIVKDAESSFVYLHGEVVTAGEFEYRPGLTVEKAIVLAGGFTLRASKKKISISRYDGVASGGEPISLRRVKLHTPVRPGDVIKVGASWF